MRTRIHPLVLLSLLLHSKNVSAIYECVMPRMWMSHVLVWMSHVLVWCCFYCFVRDSLVDLLETLYAQNRFFSMQHIGFSDISVLCVQGLCLYQQPFFFPSQPGSYAWLSPFLLCAYHTCVLVCVCLCMCIWKCVGKVISINKYKQTRDDVTCSFYMYAYILWCFLLSGVLHSKQKETLPIYECITS